MRLRKKDNKDGRSANGRQRPAPRTTTGAFSYYASSRRLADQPGAARHQPPPKPKLSRVVFQRLGQQFGMILLGMVLLACVISLLQIDTVPRVVIANNSEGYALHRVSDYQASATTVLRSSLLNSNKLTIDTKSVDAALTAQYPEVAHASIALPLVGHRPTLYVVLTKPTLILATPHQSVVVDSAGHALVTAQTAHDVARFQLPVLHDQSNRQLQIGDTVLPSSTISFIQEVLRQFAAAHLRVATMVMPPAAEELDVYPAGASYYGKFNLHDSSARQQSGTFLAVRQQLSHGQGSLPKQYIDVRIPGRAYYK